MNKKLIIGIVIIVVIILSQWLGVKMIYSGKLDGQVAHLMSKVYHLKAGTIEKDDDKLVLLMSDFIDNKKFINNFLSSGSNTEKIPEEAIDEIVWDKMIKEAWLNHIADFFNVNISDQDVDDNLNQLDDFVEFKAKAEEEFGINFEDYKRFVAKPSILEAKVYEVLIDNYNDREGIQKAQNAYDALVGGKGFVEVAKIYASDMTFVENSIWLSEDELISMYEPIKDLSVGEFSKIVNTPGAYIIWKLESVNQEEGKNIYEVKSIVIVAKTLQSFLDDFLAVAQVEKIY
jgi:hypothetical protein